MKKFYLVFALLILFINTAFDQCCYTVNFPYSNAYTCPNSTYTVTWTGPQHEPDVLVNISVIDVQANAGEYTLATGVPANQGSWTGTLWIGNFGPGTKTIYVQTTNAANMTWGYSNQFQLISNTPTIPSFDPVGPYCSGATIPALPTTSQNGVTGTWSPTINNTATTTYTFTPTPYTLDAAPTPEQCASTSTLTINITLDVTETPNFADVGPYCSGSSIPNLPTTSQNGITGTWSPAINNTATTTYTFTPAAGQCALTTTLTINISPNVKPTFASVGPYCVGANIPDFPTTSQDGITGTWSPTINNNQTTEYTFTPSSGECAESTSITIIVESCASIEDVVLENEKTFTLIPNPTNSTTVLSFNTLVDNGSVSIFDVLGRHIQSSAFQNSENLTIEASNLEPGIYFILVTNGNVKHTCRLVVTK